VLVSLAGCGHPAEEGRGMRADDPSQVLVELIERKLNEKDFMELCSVQLSEEKVITSLDAWESCGGYYTIVKSGDTIYKEIVGRNIFLKKNEISLGFYGGEVGDVWSMRGKGFVILAYDKKTETYLVANIRFKAEA